MVDVDASAVMCGVRPDEDIIYQVIPAAVSGDEDEEDQTVRLSGRAFFGSRGPIEFHPSSLLQI